MHHNMDINELKDLLNQGHYDEQHEDFNSDDDKDAESEYDIPWWQFNVHSFSMHVWGCLFAVVVWYALIFVPLACVFHKSFHDNANSQVDWFALDIFNETIWTIQFFINMNRVDPVRKIFKFKDTFKAYLRSPFLIPDALVLTADWTLISLGKLQ